MPKSDYQAGYDYGLDNANRLYSRIDTNDLLELATIHTMHFWETGDQLSLGRAVFLRELAAERKMYA